MRLGELCLFEKTKTKHLRNKICMIVDSVMNFNCQLGLNQEGHDWSNKNNLWDTDIPELGNLEIRDYMCMSVATNTTICCY